MTAGAALPTQIGSVTDVAAYDTISLLTDFGYADEFVGVMKAVIRDLAPDVAMIDLTHGIPAFNVRAGSLALARAVAYLPSGVVVAVVDPGVGTTRRAIAIEVANAEGVFVGPDNGLLAPAVSLAGGAERAVELNNSDFQLAAPGATFAGRDIFAPAAAHLCNGVPITELGDLVDPAELFPGAVPLPRRVDDGIVSEVLWVDRYGNCQLNIGPDDLPAGWGPFVQLEFDAAGLSDGQTRIARQVEAFGELSTGELGIVLDSVGLFAISLNQRSVAEELGIGTGDQVALTAIVGRPPTITEVRLQARPQATRPDPEHESGYRER